MEDKRFAHIANDPKFRRIPKNEKKVKIDKRFQSMFSDKNFKVKYTTDKRGRPVTHTSTEDLKRYYDLSSDDSEVDSENEKETGQFVKAPKEELNNELKIKCNNDKNITDDLKSKLKDLNVDYARGESALYSESSSDDDESDVELSDTDEIDHKWGELDADAQMTENATRRLGVCNMDWDRIRAVDLMVLFNSFLPPGGAITDVQIYPSEFGKKRMAEEEIKGPIELVETKREDKSEEETEEGSKFHMEKLRQYQLNRLKYYYAVVTFDNANSANKIYTECDGMEYESSATKIDLRFIPEDMTFDDEPKDTCNKLPELNKYEPRFFTTTALQQAKVDLTWDETNPERVEITQKLNTGKIDDISENDLQNYLAGSSDEEEIEDINKDYELDGQEPDNVVDKYKALLQDIEDNEIKKKNKDIEMEITWGLGLKEETEKMVKKKLANSEEKTPFQHYLDKRKDKKKEKREQRKNKHQNETEDDSDIPSNIDMNDPYFAEEFKNSEFKKKKNKRNFGEKEDDEKNDDLELLLMNDEDGKKHFNLKKIQDEESEVKTKRKRKNRMIKDKPEQEKDDFEVNVNDNRFSALFTSHHFNIDPTDPHYKKTKGMESLISEKLKRRTTDTEENEMKKIKSEKKNKKDADLSLLVKSVKRKAQAFKNK